MSERIMKLYFNPRPNALKVVLYFEEAGIDYELIPVDLLRGEQLSESFRQLNPNAKVPVLIDGNRVVFDSTAILLYLVERYGKFAPRGGGLERAAFLSWLLFIASGVGPFSGQAVHFAHYAPSDQDYARERYNYEADRHWAILECRLADHHFMIGQDYGVVDMALWPWASGLPYILGEDAWSTHPNIRRWVAEIAERPAVQRLKAVEQKFAFKQEVDEEARRIMFPQVPVAMGRATSPRSPAARSSQGT